MVQTKERIYKKGDIVTINGSKHLILERLKGYTKYKCKDLDRGLGWDEISKTYKGVKNKSGWFRGENFEYENVSVKHRNQFD